MNSFLSFKQILHALFALQILSLLVSFFLISTVSWTLAGAFMGKFAIYTLWITIIPGILSRLRVQGRLKAIQIVLMKDRRWLGIVMYGFSLLHLVWSGLFPKILAIQANNPLIIPAFEIFGLVTFILLTPLFLTSNNISIRLLGKNWKKLHKLIYIGFWTVTAHVVMQPPVSFLIYGFPIGIEYTVSYGVPTITLITLQIYSFIYAKKTTMSKE